MTTIRIRDSALFHIGIRNAKQEFIHMSPRHADDSYLESVDSVLYQSLSLPAHRQWWKTTRQGFNKAFQSHVNEIMAATGERSASSAFNLSNKDPT